MNAAADEGPYRPEPRTSILSWQHLQVTLPHTWHPVHIRGDFRAGQLDYADGRGPALGLRWSTPSPRRFDAAVAVRKAREMEVGQLAAAEAQPASAGDGSAHSVLFSEPSPPGRDVWSGYSRATGRLVQMVYFAGRRDTLFRDRLLPTLIEHPAGRATPWSIFDLSLVAPAEASLVGQRLNAGDLTLQFSSPIGAWSIRQLAPASLAIERRPLSDWVRTPMPNLGTAGRSLSRFYRLASSTLPDPEPAEFARAAWTCRRRYFWMFRLAARRVTIGRVDPARDRLVLLEGADEPLLREISKTVGSAG